MSTDWGIGCRTCALKWRGKDDENRWDDREQYFTGEFNNCRGTKALYDLIAARKEIVALSDAGVGDLVSFHWNTSSWADVAHEVPEFFAKHRDHDLEPMDEYLRFATEVGYEVRTELTKDEVNGWSEHYAARALCGEIGVDYVKVSKSVVASLLLAHEVGRRRGRASR